MIRQLFSCFASILLLGGALGWTPAPSAPATGATLETWRGPETIGQITEAAINETSGLAASLHTEGLLWAHNDSGNEPVLYTIGPSGDCLGSVRIEGAVNRDWEDIASYEIDGRAYLIIGDIGDNNAVHPECVLYVIAEPSPDELSPTRQLTVTPERVIRYVYPGGPRDCESLAVDSCERSIYLISKRTQPPILYRLPLFPEDTSKHPLIAEDTSKRPLIAEELGPINGILQPSGLLSKMSVPWGKWRGQPCSLDISPDGKTAALLTYGEVYLYERQEGEDWASTFARGGHALAAHNLPQAEGLCFSRDGQSLYVTTEGSPAPLLRYTTRSTPDHAPKRKPRRSRRGQARQSFYGAEGSPSLWRRSSDRRVGVLHTAQ